MDKKNVLYLCKIETGKDDGRYGGIFVCVADSIDAVKTKVNGYCEKMGFSNVVLSVHVSELGTFETYNSDVLMKNITNETTIKMIL